MPLQQNWFLLKHFHIIDKAANKKNFFFSTGIKPLSFSSVCGLLCRCTPTGLLHTEYMGIVWGYHLYSGFRMECFFKHDIGWPDMPLTDSSSYQASRFCVYQREEILKKSSRTLSTLITLPRHYFTDFTNKLCPKASQRSISFWQNNLTSLVQLLFIHVHNPLLFLLKRSTRCVSVHAIWKEDIGCRKKKRWLEITIVMEQWPSVL